MTFLASPARRPLLSLSSRHPYPVEPRLLATAQLHRNYARTSASSETSNLQSGRAPVHNLTVIPAPRIRKILVDSKQRRENRGKGDETEGEGETGAKFAVPAEKWPSLKARLEPLYESGWSLATGLYRRKAIEQGWLFADFGQAFRFMSRVAEMAEAENHHPDLAISGRYVFVRWMTHQSKSGETGLTGRDIRLAETCNQLASELDGMSRDKALGKEQNILSSTKRLMMTAGRDAGSAGRHVMMLGQKANTATAAAKPTPAKSRTTLGSAKDAPLPEGSEHDAPTTATAADSASRYIYKRP